MARTRHNPSRDLLPHTLARQIDERPPGRPIDPRRRDRRSWRRSSSSVTAYGNPGARGQPGAGGPLARKPPPAGVRGLRGEIVERTTSGDGVFRRPGHPGDTGPTRNRSLAVLGRSALWAIPWASCPYGAVIASNGHPGARNRYRLWRGHPVGGTGTETRTAGRRRRRLD